MAVYVTRNKGVPRRLNAYTMRDVTSDPDVVDVPSSDVECATYPAPSDPPWTEPPPPDVPAPCPDPAQQKTAHLSVLALPFFAYLTFSNRLPGWARMTSALLGAGVLFAEGGFIQSWVERQASEQPLFQGMGGCGCGCGGKPGGCGG